MKIGVCGVMQMENEVLKDLGMQDRNEVLVFLKKLWQEQPSTCPKCGGTLELLHKKAKKSNCDWKCPACGEVYKTLHILDKLNER